MLRLISKLDNTVFNTKKKCLQNGEYLCETLILIIKMIRTVVNCGQSIKCIISPSPNTTNWIDNSKHTFKGQQRTLFSLCDCKNHKSAWLQISIKNMKI